MKDVGVVSSGRSTAAVPKCGVTVPTGRPREPGWMGGLGAQGLGGPIPEDVKQTISNPPSDSKSEP